MIKKTLFFFFFFLSIGCFAQFYNYNYKPRISRLDGEVLENDPDNAKNLSVLITPLDGKFLSSDARASLNVEMNYRSPKERFWINASYSYDYGINYWEKVLDSRPLRPASGEYTNPSSSYKTSIGFNFFSRIINRNRTVLIAGRMMYTKTVAIVPADYYKCFGIHAGFESYTRYVYSEYYFEKDPKINNNSAILTINYSSSNVESFATISYISAGFHYQDVDDIKIKVKHNNTEKTRYNKATTLFYIDLLFPVSRSFENANVLVGVDSSSYEPIFAKLPISTYTPLSKMGFKAGGKITGLRTVGSYAAVELGFLPGPKNIFYNIMLNLKLGFSLNFKAKKTLIN